jgi:hypothetical protein
MRTRARAENPSAKKGGFGGGKALLFFAALVLLSAAGYLVHEKSGDVGRSDDKPGNKRVYSVNTVPEEQGTKKVGNVPPAVKKARLQLESVDNIDRVKVIVEDNQNHNARTTYRYEWFRNGRPFGDSDDSVTGFDRGDRIDVKITPSMGRQDGQPAFLSINIARVPPKIVADKTIRFDGYVLSYQVRAVDAGGATLSYSLIDPPKDMTIDGETGIINWRVAANERGRRDVNVMIKSSSGAEVVYPLSIDIGTAIR